MNTRKNLSIGIVIFFQSISFSFYRMKGIHYSANYPTLQPHRASQNDPELQTIFLYDQNTHLRLEYSFRNEDNGTGKKISFRKNNIIHDFKPDYLISENVITPLRFFNCDFNYDAAFWDNFLHKFTVYEADINFNYSKEIKYFSVVKQKINSLENKYEKTVDIKRTLNSLSGIEIDNTGEEVILHRHKESIPLKEALQKYFNSSVDFSFLGTYVKPETFQSPSLSYKKRMESPLLNESPKLKFSYRPVLPEESFDLLNESKILTVWCLIPDKINNKEIQSQLIGLAEDKEGDLFHWAIDLKDDISALVPKKGVHEEIKSRKILPITLKDLKLD